MELVENSLKSLTMLHKYGLDLISVMNGIIVLVKGCVYLPLKITIFVTDANIEIIFSLCIFIKHYYYCTSNFIIVMQALL